jgi:hypothetical protein
MSFQKWAIDWSGCDGGDLGTAEQPGIWQCGLEWGVQGNWEYTADKLLSIFKKPIDISGYETIDDLCSPPFNQSVLKILTVLSNKETADYLEFARTEKPFMQGSKGFFKMNLYPLWFPNFDDAHWHEGCAEATGFQTKAEYKLWISQHRFPFFRQQMQTHQPKLILCVGIGSRDHFKMAFLDEKTELNSEVIEDRTLYWARNAGTLLAIVPFATGGSSGSLNKDSTKQLFGQRIAELLASK